MSTLTRKASSSRSFFGSKGKLRRASSLEPLASSRVAPHSQPPGLKSCLSTRNTSEDDSIRSLKHQKSHSSEPVSTNTNAESPPRRVSFHKVEIREYERILGDNPAVTGGPAVGIGWQYEPLTRLDLDQYEESRPERRTAEQFRMPTWVRVSILKKHCSLPNSKITQASREIEAQKRQRRATMAAMEFEATQVVVSSVVRKLKRFVKITPTTQQEQDDLWRNAQILGNSSTSQDDSSKDAPPEMIPVSDDSLLLVQNNLEKDNSSDGTQETTLMVEEEEEEEEEE